MFYIRLQEKKWLFLLLIGLLMACGGKTTNQNSKKNTTITPGAERMAAYLPRLKDKNVGLVVNQTSRVGEKHLVDTLLNRGINISRIFAPEHGFRGDVGAGVEIESHKDKKTGIPVTSLYGDTRKPAAEDIKDLDVIVFDIQDVGARFYTYISTMHYVMEACAKHHVKFMVLDRPNPNGDYVDGPVLDTSEFRSFVGMHPIPVVHGMTVGELARMTNGEKWLDTKSMCNLTIVKVKNYKHEMQYSLPVNPSPNLPNDKAIELYPSLCFFEATQMSIGRGTKFPFQVIGYPDSSFGEFTFTPRSIPGAAKNPKHEDKKCFGVDLREKEVPGKINLKYLIQFYNTWDKDKPFFSRPDWMNLLAGNDSLIKKIRNGMSADAIRKTWEDDLKAFKKKRKKYLLYK